MTRRWNIKEIHETKHLYFYSFADIFFECSLLFFFYMCVCEIEAANLLRISRIVLGVARKIAKSFILMATCWNSILAVFRGTWNFFSHSCNFDIAIDSTLTENYLLTWTFKQFYDIGNLLMKIVEILMKLLTLTKLTPKQATHPHPPSGATFLVVFCMMKLLCNVERDVPLSFSWIVGIELKCMRCDFVIQLSCSTNIGSKKFNRDLFIWWPFNQVIIQHTLNYNQYFSR